MDNRARRTSSKHARRRLRWNTRGIQTSSWFASLSDEPLVASPVQRKRKLRLGLGWILHRVRDQKELIRDKASRAARHILSDSQRIQG